MANENEILERLKKKIGVNMTKSRDFDVLAQAIKDKTKESLGVNTLKRLFGYKTDKVVPRLSTLDVIAQYLDCADYETLMKDLGEDADISNFTLIDSIESPDLERGTQLRVSYAPNRILILSYLGDSRFIVNEVVGSKNICKGDILSIAQFVVAHRLVVSNVSRDGTDLGPYEAAKFKGLKSVEII